MAVNSETSRLRHSDYSNFQSSSPGLYSGLRHRGALAPRGHRFDAHRDLRDSIALRGDLSARLDISLVLTTLACRADSVRPLKAVTSPRWDCSRSSRCLPPAAASSRLVLARATCSPRRPSAREAALLDRLEPADADDGALDPGRLERSNGPSRADSSPCSRRGPPLGPRSGGSDLLDRFLSEGGAIDRLVGEDGATTGPSRTA